MIPVKSDGKIDAETAISSFISAETDNERKAEVARLAASFKLNPFEVLGVALNATTPEVNKQYRDLSLLVHPDKFKPEDRAEAEKSFTILTAAKNELLDEAKRGQLNELVKQARQKAIEAKENEFKAERKKEIAEIRAKNPAAIIPDKAIPDFEKAPGFEDIVKAQLKELLIDREWRTRQLLKMASQEEQLAAKEKESKDTEKKAKEQTEQEWEQNREKRVGSWRTWMQGKTPGGKKRLRQPKLPKLTAEDPNKTYIKRLKTSKGYVGGGEEDDEKSKP
jgi:DnaJ family protein C protein 8